MSSASLPDRPFFRSVEQDSEVESPHVSRLAVVALIVGVLSLGAFLSNVFLPLAGLAILIGIVALIAIARAPLLRGSRLALAGLGLGLVSLVASLTFAERREGYLYSVAGAHAETFLDYLSREETYYEALELLRSEQDRQITGTDLKAYYENANEEVTDAIKGFLNTEGTKLVLQAKGSADWKYQRGIRTWGTPDNIHVVVEMKNQASDAGETLHVTMQRIEGLLVRDEGQPTAHWNVYDLTIP